MGPLNNINVPLAAGDRITLSGGGTFRPPGGAVTPVTGTLIIDITAALAGTFNFSGGVAVSCITAGEAQNSSDSASNNFLELRIDTLASLDPDLTGQLLDGNGDGSNPVNVAAAGNSRSGSLAFSTSLADLQSTADVQPASVDLTDRAGSARTSAFDVWIKGKYAWARNEGQRADLGVLYLGADYRLSPDVVLGLIGQFDWIDERDRDTGSDGDGFGWMVGPYVVARLHQNLLFDARGAVGTSDNDVTTAIGAKGEFDTTRWLVKSRLTGVFSYESVTINPFAEILYIEEDRERYTDSRGLVVSGRTISLGRLKFGPRISTSFEGGDGIVVSPHLTMSGIYDFDRAGRLTQTGLSSSTDRVRAKIEGGVGVTMPGGVKVEGEAFYDGIGADQFDIYGGSLKVTVPLN